MKVVFLDVDGVLNCASRWGQLPKAGILEGSQIDPLAVARLKRILDATGAKIVVSSTWRLYHYVELVLFLGEHGIARREVIGQTPHMGKERGHEIQAWLDQNHEVTRFAILDDDIDMLHLHPYLVKTTWQDGLLDEHVDEAIQLLKGDHGN